MMAPEFLTRLVDRAIGVESQLAPRVSSMFEPASRIASVANSAWEPGTSDDADGDATAIVARPERRAPVTPLLLGSDSGTRARRPPLPLCEDAERTVSNEDLQQRGSATAQETANETSRLVEKGASAPRVVANRPPVQLVSAPVPHLPDRTTHRSRRESTIGEPEEHASAIRTAAAERPSPTGALVPLRAQVVAVLPSFTDRRERGHSRREESHLSEPTVHVSIGRVEVRATRESPVPQRVQRKRPSPLSLDDYLIGRGGAR